MQSDTDNLQTDACLRGRVEQMARTAGARRAAHALGVSRESLLGVLAGMPVRAGTLALIRERLRELDGLDASAKAGTAA